MKPANVSKVLRGRTRPRMVREIGGEHGDRGRPRLEVGVTGRESRKFGGPREGTTPETCPAGGTRDEGGGTGVGKVESSLWSKFPFCKTGPNSVMYGNLEEVRGT